MNLALLVKLAWMVTKREDLMWVNMLEARYLKGNSFFEQCLEKRSHTVWKVIIYTRPSMSKRACFKVRDGFAMNP